MLRSIKCWSYYAGFEVKGILQEAGSLGENSQQRCVTYIQQLQMYLFCLGATSALPLVLFFSPSSALSLPAATHLLCWDFIRPTTLGAASPDFSLLLAFFQFHLFTQSFHFLLYSPCTYSSSRWIVSSVLLLNYKNIHTQRIIPHTFLNPNTISHHPLISTTVSMAPCFTLLPWNLVAVSAGGGGLVWLLFNPRWERM